MATVFWASVLETWVGRERWTLALLPLARDAALMAATAAAVDYLAMPKRFTPGWELVLTRRSMALAYVALGAGLAIGVLAGHGGRRAPGRSRI